MAPSDQTSTEKSSRTKKSDLVCQLAMIVARDAEKLTVKQLKTLIKRYAQR